jgi:hypothetical protein
LTATGYAEDSDFLVNHGGDLPGGLASIHLVAGFSG